MKRLLLILALLLCVGFWVASCKKGDKATVGQTGTQAVAPTCSITMPVLIALVGASYSGDVQMTFTLRAQNSGLVDLEIFYSDGSGSHAASAASGSSTSNPARSLSTPGTYSFTWASATDIPGAVPTTTIIGRVTDKASNLFGLCSTQIPVDNTPPVINQAPTCAITAPSGTTESGDVTINYNTADADGDPIVATIQYSTASQFKLTTPTTSYANPTSASPPGTGKVYVWKSATDEATYSGAVTVRITVNDGTTQSSCSTNFTLDNSPPAQPFACTLTSPVQGATVRGTIPISFNMTGIATGIMGILEFYDGTIRRMVDGVWSVPVASPGSSTRQWNSVASGVGVSAPETGTLYLNLLGTGGTSAVCSVTQIIVDNKNPPPAAAAPTCSITSPISSSPTQTGNVVIRYNTSDPNSGDRVDVKIEYRRQTGAFALATLLGSNPIVGTTPGTGKSSTWVSTTDFPAPYGPATANIKITVTDQGGLSNTCTTSFTLENPSGPTPNDPPTCNIVGPPAGGTYSGLVTIGYDTQDPDGDALNVSFDYDAGSGFRRATPQSPYTNPRSLPAPTTALDYVWGSTTDLPTQRANITFKVTVNDGQASATCTRAFIVDNQPAPPAVSFVNDIYPIFSARGCTGCHGSSGGLTLTGTSSAVYSQIVPSRINLSNPPASLIYAKPTGGTSHVGGFPLAGTQEAQDILDWIRQGAQNN